MSLHTPTTSPSWMPDMADMVITTFNSLFSRYQFLHLPFDLIYRQDIFQKRMKQILEKCKGCIGIVDDIIVHDHIGEDYDVHLHNLMETAFPAISGNAASSHLP